MNLVISYTRDRFIGTLWDEFCRFNVVDLKAKILAYDERSWIQKHTTFHGAVNIYLNNMIFSVAHENGSDPTDDLFAVFQTPLADYL